MADEESNNIEHPYNLKFEYNLTKEQFEQISDAISNALGVKPKVENKGNIDPDCDVKTKIIGHRSYFEQGVVVPSPGHGIPIPTPVMIRVNCTTYQSTTICPQNSTYTNTWEECDKEST